MKHKYRFAPSSTGTLHTGSARTAIANFLLAKNNGADFVLRIEDTDKERSKQEFEDNIKSGLEWLGIEWSDECKQSERIHIYRHYADELLKSGNAFKEEGSIKLKVSKELLTLNDGIRGVIERQTDFDNIVIMKSDGMATFLFANTIDDYLQGITHVVRGEDHISNTFPQLQIYKSLNFNPPEFSHLSLIFAPDRTKLSKRNGSKSIDTYKSEGILSEALFNYIALMGFNCGNTEIYSKEELYNIYETSKIKKSPVCYDEGKLLWFNKKWKNIKRSNI